MIDYEREVEMLGCDRQGSSGRGMLGVGLMVALLVSFAGIMIDAGIESGVIAKLGEIEFRIAEVLDVDYISKENGQVRRVVCYRWLGEGHSIRHFYVCQYYPDGEMDVRNGLESGQKIIFKDGEIVLYEPEE